MAEDFHRAHRDTSVIIATCHVDPPSAGGVGGEVTPRSDERLARCPGIAKRLVDVYLVRRIGRDSATAHDSYF
jgi:hypothetical protein